MSQEVFQRYEKKYLLTEQVYEELRKRLDFHMQEDVYGLHTIRNIYYDTKSSELIRTSLEKPVYKEKFRIRCYGMPTKDSTIFLEIKKKYRGVVYKRRVEMTGEEAEEYLHKGVYRAEKSQILKEIDYFLKMHPIEPRLYLAYDRIALFGNEDPEFRVTFDQNIRSRWDHLELTDDTETEKLLEDGLYLMEVKTRDSLPLWFVQILSDLQIRSTSFSKYGRIYQKKCMEDTKKTDLKDRATEESVKENREEKQTQKGAA